MKETLFLTTNMHGWHMKDGAGHHISTFNTRQLAEQYAQDMGYRLQIQINGKIEWFN